MLLAFNFISSSYDASVNTLCSFKNINGKPDTYHVDLYLILTLL